MKPQSTIDNFKDLANSCSKFYVQNMNRSNQKEIQEIRAKLSGHISSFHNDCGTLTMSVEEQIKNLNGDNCIILMSAHQPNLFCYSGVLRKATLCFALEKFLEKKFRVPVISFFGIADQDFTDDRWVRVFHLPSVARRDGILELQIELPERVMLNKTPRPSITTIKRISKETGDWLEGLIKSIDKLYKMNYPSSSHLNLANSFRENFESFWDIVEDSYDRALSYSDFNAFIMSKIINDIWGYDTLFSRFSDCQQIFVNEFSFLLSNFNRYSNSLREAINLSESCNNLHNISYRETELIPFWYHCDCGSKARLIMENSGNRLKGTGNCLVCNQHYELDFGNKDHPTLIDIQSRISARSIAMILVFFKGLNPSCYVGGIGGMSYLAKARYVARIMEIPFSPIAYWRPHDRYLGLGQLEAILEYKRICKYLDAYDYFDAANLLRLRIDEVNYHLETIQSSKKRAIEAWKENPQDEVLKEDIKNLLAAETDIRRTSNLSSLVADSIVLGKILSTLDLMPSIIDYAVSIGLKETSKQWIAFLNENGNLYSDVTLESILSRDEGTDLALSKGLLTGIAELKLARTV
jgi:hypothetical protein